MRLSLILLMIISGGPIYVHIQAQEGYVRPADKPSDSKEPDSRPRPIANEGDLPINPSVSARPGGSEPVRTRGPRRGALPPSSGPTFLEASNQQAVYDVIDNFNSSGDPKRVLRIIQFPDKSLFVLDNGKVGNRYQYTVLKVKEPLTSDGLREQLKEELKKNPGKTFIGVHRLDDSSYLMVFYGR